MQSNLLIGNGLNIHLGITDLKQENIFERFKDVLLRSSPFYELLFKVKLTPEVLDTIFFSAPNIGIEPLAYALYTYIRQHMYDQVSINSEIRLLDSIKTSAINAIFYKDTKRIDFDNINPTTISHINKYDNIFTLNYYEVCHQNPKQDIVHILALVNFQFVLISCKCIFNGIKCA